MSTPTLGLLCTIALAGFASPRYVSPDPVNDATGFDISRFDAVGIAFESAHTATLVAEQTLDPAGVAGWFPVQGRTVGSAQAQLSSSGSTNTNAYVYPQVGLRMRFRVTALSAADLVARLAFLTSYRDMSTTAGAAAAHDAAISGNPMRVAGRAVSANYTAVASGDVADFITTLVGVQITRPFSIPENDWSMFGGINNSAAAIVLKAAGAAGIRNYLTSLSIGHDTLGAVTEIAVRDGAGGTTLWRGRLQTTAKEDTQISFPTPLRGTAATLLEIVTGTAVTGAIYINAQGYQAP